MGSVAEFCQYPGMINSQTLKSDQLKYRESFMLYDECADFMIPTFCGKTAGKFEMQNKAKLDFCNL